MDDQHTHNTLDNLADLFLTDAEDAAPDDGDVKRPGAKANMVDQLEGSTPIRLVPKIVSSASSEPESGPHEVGHGDESVAGVIGQASAAAPTVEAVFLSNLPGYGGPWLTQYAHRLSQRQGPVAILHMEDDKIDVELVSTCDDPTLPPHTDESYLHGDTPPSHALADCLHDLSQQSAAGVGTWLIHLPTPVTSQWVAKALDVPRWTILSGADDMAMVGAYQLLKQLIESDAGAKGHHVGLMVVGSDERASHIAARKLNETAASFLETPVELVGWRQQMMPLGHRVIGSFSGDALWSSVCGLWEYRPRVLVDAEVAEPMAPKPTAVAEPDITASAMVDGLAPAEMGLAESLADQHNARHDQDDPDLASYLPGMIALPARCPRHPEHQLVLDEKGRLHLLRQCDGDNGNGVAHGLGSAVADLIEVHTWAYEHMDLLQQTQRQLRFDIDAEPVMHVFTDQAKAAAALAGRSGDFVQVHLFQQVEVGGKCGWVCSDLN